MVEPSLRYRWLRQVSFGSTAGIVTSLGLIVGLSAASTSRSMVIGSLLIVALADNLTDSLGVHIYQESEELAEREALHVTIANFLTRLIVSLSFIGLVLVLPSPLSLWVSLLWGLWLLSILSYLLARERHADAFGEIIKHCGVALLVIALSLLVGMWIHTESGA